MKQINQDIETQQFQQVYLFYGEEDYLVTQYKNKLLNALLYDKSNMNSHYFEGKDMAVGKLVDLAETVPFLADKRVFLIENSGSFKSNGQGEEFANYVADMAETAYFIFIEREVDKRSKLYKAVKEKGYIAEFKTPEEKEIKRWIVSILKADNKKIQETMVEYFMEKVGIDMATMRLELEKIICYVGDKEVIQKEDIDAVCITKISNHIFDMITEIANQNQGKAIKLYYELLALREPPLRILALLVRQYRNLYMLKSLLQAEKNQSDMSKATGIPSYYINKYLIQAKKYKSEDLQQCLSYCVVAEEEIKTGKLTDLLGVEMVIMTLLEYS